MVRYNKSRHDFLSKAALTLAATQLNLLDGVAAQTGVRKGEIISSVEPDKNTYGLLKQVDAGLLSVGYVEAGPIDGPVVILLHGWPYDIHSFVDVTPLLVSAVTV